MENIMKLLGMGQYGVYVWASFIVATIIIIVMLLITLRLLRRAQKTLLQLQHNKD